MLVNERAKERDSRRFDSEASLLEAKNRLPLCRLMEQHGDAPPPVGLKWGACPFCKKKATARITENGRQQFFKCANDNCPSETSAKGKSWTEIHYFTFKTGLRGKDAFMGYLKEAGVWEERTRFKGKAELAPASSPSLEPPPPSADDTPSATDENGGNPPVDSGADSQPAEPPTEVPSSTPKPKSNVVDVAFDQKPEAEPVPKKLDGHGGYAALMYFFGQLSLNESDNALLFQKRGLDSRTSKLLRFKSSGRANRAILEEMTSKFSTDELLSSGLWKRNPRRQSEIKPNGQFFGCGIIGKAVPGRKLESGQWIDDDGALWGWSNPILIPYFDKVGMLCGLRPHKGGGPGDTVTGKPRIYVPRAPRSERPDQEGFETVIITEGEFKAAALWQVVGTGHLFGIGDRMPCGVVAMPGIPSPRITNCARNSTSGWVR